MLILNILAVKEQKVKILSLNPYPILPCYALSYVTLPCPALPYTARPFPHLPYPTLLTYPVLYFPTLRYSTIVFLSRKLT